MAFTHGVYTKELPTSIIPAAASNAGLPVVFGTAPLHLAADPAKANRPVLCSSYKEAVELLGYSKDWKKYTLCEVMYSQFALYNQSPVVFVNVLDPKVHKKHVDNQTAEINDNEAVIESAVLLTTLKVKVAEAGEPLTEGVDYEAGYNDKEQLVISVLEGGLLEGAASLTVSFDELDASAISYEDIIGGVSVTDGSVKGLEVVNHVFPVLGMVPGILAAPGWTHEPEVAAVMKAKASNINSHFKAIIITDMPTDVVSKYSQAYEWKSKNSYNGVDQIVCWPMVNMGDDIYHLSTHVMGVIATVDANNNDIPYESPSNKNAQITGLCLEDGTEVVLGPDEANFLNQNGVVTCLNFFGGWVIWGNRTACYPANTDPKDCQISIRRMFNWHAQTFIKTYWQKLDKPTNRRLIQTIMDSENVRLNGLVAAEILLGARVEFNADENPTTDLMDGKIVFHTYFTPPLPAETIRNDIEFDPSYFSVLFG